MVKSNLAFAAEVLSSDIPKLLKQISRSEYAQKRLLEDGEIISSPMTFEESQRLKLSLKTLFPAQVQEAERLNNNSKARSYRFYRHMLLMMLSFDVTFLTLTFSDDVLNNTSSETRRRYVRRFLSQFNAYFVANKDFGSKNHREHYHAVINCRVDVSSWAQKCGHALASPVKIDGEFVRLSDKLKLDIDALFSVNARRLAKYTAKLTNHAIKETSAAERSIFCNDLSKILPNNYFRAKALVNLGAHYDINELYKFVWRMLEADESIFG